MASNPLRAANNNNISYIATGVVDANGNPYLKSSIGSQGNQAPPPGGGDGLMVDVRKLETRISGAFIWLGLLTFAAGAAFLFLINNIGDLRKDIGSVQALVAAQSATTSAIQGSITRIEDKLDKPVSNRRKPN